MTFNSQQSRLRLFVSVSLMLLAPVVPAQNSKSAEKPNATAAKPQTQVNRTHLTKMSSLQENEALKFARKHHPELGHLLERLRSTSPSGFARGIREVHLARQRLERFREKQPVRFADELKNWKTDSKIRLLTAKWAMSQDPELEEQIRELLRSRQRARFKRLKEDRAKLTARLEQLDGQLGLGAEELELDLVDEWNRLARQAATTAKSQRRKTKKKSTARTKSTTTPEKSPETKRQTK